MSKLNNIILISVIISGLLIFINTVLYIEVDEMRIPQSTYLIVIIAIFFIDIIAFMFIQMDFMSNNSSFSTFILSLTFFSSLVYLTETIIIIQQPIKPVLSVQMKANDTAIFYLFRQCSFIFLLFIAVVVRKIEDAKRLGKLQKLIICLICLIPTVLFPIYAHNLSSYNPQYTLMLTDYTNIEGKAIWDISYINILIIMWAGLAYLIISSTKLNFDLWNSMLIICLSAIVYNFFLLFLDKYNLSIWYTSRVIEVLSKLFVIGSLMLNVFTKLKIANNLAIRDPMTQLYNRNYFFEHLNELLIKKTDKGICVMIIDLDNFKKINDTWGHHVGDMVIMAIIDIIKNNIHNDVILARLGGEEFGLILKNIEVNEASKFGGRLCEAVREGTAEGNKYNTPRVTTISIGGAYIYNGIFLSSQITRTADKALYDVKHNGRNGCIIKIMKSQYRN